MLLTVDIGNTSITFGIFDKENIIKTFRLPSEKTLSCEEYQNLIYENTKNCQINSCIIASVVDELGPLIKDALDKLFENNSVLISSKSKLGFELKIKKPSEAGADRIANACGALALYPKPAIVVDLGTATTFDIINADGDFIGGVIMPGLNMQLKALNDCTSKLPKTEIQEVEKAIGDSTVNAILSGVIRGSASAIEGLISQCEKELGEKAFIVATGGYSKLISDYMTRSFDAVNPNLTLEGLRFLYELNKDDE